MPDKDVMLQIRQLDEQIGWRAAAEVEHDPDETDPPVTRFANALAQLAGDWRMLADLYDKAKLKGAKTAYVDPLRHAAVELDKVVKQLGQPRRAPLGQLQDGRSAAPPAPPQYGPKHRLEVGEGARTCGFLTNGPEDTPTPCGMLPAHPVHDFQARDLAGLDSLIADSVAQHRGEVRQVSEPTPEGSALGVTDEQRDDPGKLASDVREMVGLHADASRDPAPPWLPAENDVAAYLSGALDDIPGARGPSSVRDATEDPALAAALQRSVHVQPYRVLVTGSRTWHHAGVIEDALKAELARHGTALVVVHGHCPEGADAIADAWCKNNGVIAERHPADWGGPLGKGAGFARNAAMVDTRPAEAFAFIRDGSAGASHCAMLADRAGLRVTRFEYPQEESPVISPPIPPVPLLSQPGDAGAGYAASYVPPGGRSVTFAELLTPVPYASLPAHLSHSQGETIGKCPGQYRLQRVEQLPQVPEWAQIGGRVFHAVVEAFELAVTRGADPTNIPEADFAEKTWRAAWDDEVQRVEASSPVPRGRWRASNKGAEGETWWLANGPEMLKRYLAARPDEATASLPVSPPDPMGALEDAIELDREVFVPTAYGPVSYKAVIDRVTVRVDPRETQHPGPIYPRTLVIRDYKTGARMPRDEGQQLGEYANVLRLLGVPPSVRIVGTYFNARKGEWTPEIDLDGPGGRWSAEWFTYHVTSKHAEKVALTQGPTPLRPSDLCGGCSVRYACPIKGAKQ